MEDINVLLNSTLDQYFKTLSKTGYQNNKIVNSIVALSAISFVVNNFSQYMEDEDIRAIYNALNCLGNECIIGLLGTGKATSIFHKNLNWFKIRILENKENHMNAEDGQYRIPE